jgi:CRISPR/Cas system-associated exonuclease Cas4 (RecB family)
MQAAEWFVSSQASTRCEKAAAFLRALPESARALVLAPSLASASALCHEALPQGAIRFGWFKRTPRMLASELAVNELAKEALTPVHGLGVEAICTRVAHQLVHRGVLTRYHAVVERPGFVRALAATLHELRMASVSPAQLVEHDPDLSYLLDTYEQELARAALVDQAGVLRAALKALAHGNELPIGVPLVALDLSLWHALEGDFLAALCARASSFVITQVHGDERTREELTRVLHQLEPHHDAPPLHTDLDFLRARLFAASLPDAHAPEERGRVELLSSPGEGREAVEIVRHVLAQAARGTPFDRMAVVLRATFTYRAVIEEAFARAGVPAHFADGVERPHPEGRAFLALLECAREQLSARAFAEYLSLGVMARGERGDDEAPSVPTPRKWERLLVDAAVMHGRARWERRLTGLRAALTEEAALLEPDDPRKVTLARDAEQLSALLTFALPILDKLMALPHDGTWGEWLAYLRELSELALGQPASVQEILSELLPLAPLGPVSLRDVIRVLERRLPTRLVKSEGPALGKVLVGGVDDVLGRHFSLVFVLGLAEKLFPPRISEDPMLADAVRRKVSPRLACVDDRSRRERAFLHASVSAADERVVLSFPRFDTVHARPRVPSFYGLEVLRAVDGVLPPFDELSRRAQPGAAARMGFPAPERPEQAIDAAEYDLAVLDLLLRAPPEAQRGAAGYLLRESTHLARALRFRARRWMLGKFTPADGFVVSGAVPTELVERYSLKAKAYSPTALSAFSACPYRFFLHAIMRVSARETVSAQDELDARQRGVFFHAVQRRTLSALRERGLLPVTSQNLSEAQALLTQAFREESERAREAFAPAIEGVFRDALSTAARDLMEWLVRLADERGFTPAYFELGFGVSSSSELDPESRSEAVTLDNGMRFLGVIDMVESGRDESGQLVLRATDHKTGAMPERLGNVVSGGRVLQPLLYALALEQLFPAARVQGGRLYFCTGDAGFKQHVVLLHEHSRIVARELVENIEAQLKEGFLPAAPEPNACERCAYLTVCGPYEEQRVSKGKRADLKRLLPLHHVRNLP